MAFFPLSTVYCLLSIFYFLLVYSALLYLVITGPSLVADSTRTTWIVVVPLVLVMGSGFY